MRKKDLDEIATFHALADWEALARCDIIIDPTGDANVSTALNDLYLKALRDGRPLALLYTWVFGKGVAGQSFLNLGDGLACNRCLRVGLGGLWRHNPMRDPNAAVRPASARCGEGGYVPFPSDAPVAAAALAVRAAIDWAAGEPGHRIGCARRSSILCMAGTYPASRPMISNNSSEDASENPAAVILRRLRRSNERTPGFGFS